MEDTLLWIGVVVAVGFIGGRLATLVRLPKVTGYIVAGIVLNPSITRLVPDDFPDRMSVVTDMALAFITFSVGGTLVFRKMRKLGSAILLITLLEAELAMLAVLVGVLVLGWAFPEARMFAVISLPFAVLLGALAAPTDPSATLAVSHEYKALGPVTSTVMGVAAFDDALGIVNYSVGMVVAVALIAHRGLTLGSAVGNAAVEVLGAVAVGVALGIVVNLFAKMDGKDSDGAYITLLLGAMGLCFGVAKMLGVDELLASMAMGAVVTNFNRNSEKLFQLLERYVEDIVFALFFTLSGLHLRIEAVKDAYLLMPLFVLLRGAGKLAGAGLGAWLVKAARPVRRYTGWCLIPQGGIVVGLALMIAKKPEAAGFADTLLGVVIGATVLHELVGPILAKMALTRAGETGRNITEEDLVASYSVEDVFTPFVPGFREDTPVSEMVRSMAEMEFSAAPVLDEEGHVAGIVTLEDLRECLDDPAMGSWVVAFDVMKPAPAPLTGDTPLAEAMERLRKERVEHIPVVDSQERYLGMLERSIAHERLARDVLKRKEASGGAAAAAPAA